MRNTVRAYELKTAWATTHCVEGSHHGFGNQVTMITWHRIGTLTVNIDANTGVVYNLSDEIVVESKG
jgi:hypothetical protein